MPKTFTDQELVDGLLARDERLTRAIVQFLYHQCQKPITRLVTRQHGDEDDANDLFQDVILIFLQNVWDGKYQLRSDTKVTTYIYGIAQTKWLRELELRKNRTARFERYDREQSMLPDTPTPEQLYLNAEEVESAWAVFNQLGDRCRELLTAFYRDHLTMEQIAVELGLGTADNAKTRKYRCIQELKKLTNLWNDQPTKKPNTTGLSAI